MVEGAGRETGGIRAESHGGDAIFVMAKGLRRFWLLVTEIVDGNGRIGGRGCNEMVGF